MYDYGYGEIGNRLISACREYPIDLRLIEELLDSGIDLNMVSEQNRNDPDYKHETMLSEIIEGYDSRDYNEDFPECEVCEKKICYGCPNDRPMGRYLPEIVGLFLKHGFDCSSNKGFAGAKCLYNLNWSSYDRYILDAAKLLLKAGADPLLAIRDDPDDDCSAMSWAGTKEIAASDDPVTSNLFHALYEIMDASTKGEDFEGIQYFDQCVGKRIDRVLLCSENGNPPDFFRTDTPRGSYAHCFRDQLIIWCEDMPLCINGYTDAIIDPRIPAKMKTQVDVSAHFADCIGHRITGFSFDCFSFSKACTCYHQPITLIHLDNGKAIRFSTNSGEAARADTAAYFHMV